MSLGGVLGVNVSRLRAHGCARHSSTRTEGRFSRTTPFTGEHVALRRPAINLLIEGK
jgi:hypothetical protein